MKKDFLTNLFQCLLDDMNSVYDEMGCDDCCKNCCESDCPLCDDEDEDCEDNDEEATPTIAERLKAVCGTKDWNKELENALNHVKDAITDAIEGNFTTNAKYAEIIPDKGIEFADDPIICSILDSAKAQEFHDRILDEFGFNVLLTFTDNIDGKKTHKVALFY